MSPLSRAKVMGLLSMRDELRKTVSMTYSDIAEEVTKVGGLHPSLQSIARLHKLMQKDKQWYPGKVTRQYKVMQKGNGKNRGHKTKFTKQKKAIVARSAKSIKRTGNVPTNATNLATGKVFTAPTILNSKRLLQKSTQGDFERCSELRQWYKNHSGECPRRNSGDKTETTLAQWLERKKARRARALNNKPSGRKLTASETAHLNNIIATLSERTTNPRKKAQRTKMPLTKDHFERCSELRQWCLSHSGERPRIRSEDKTEASLACWLANARLRRARSISNGGRQLTTKETAQLNSILRATVAPLQVGHVATSKRLCQKEPEPERLNKLEMKSSQRVMKERCRELGLAVNGAKQVLLARILNETTSKLDTESSWHILRERCWEWGLPENGDKHEMLSRILSEENRLIADSLVKDSDNDQEMLKTCGGTESLLFMDNMPCQHRQTEIIAETPFKRPHTLAPTINITAGSVGGG